MAMDRTGTGLAIVRICVGVLLLFEGLSKLGWFTDAGPLTQQLTGWVERATPMNLWYLQRVALPYASVFARLVVLGELSSGLSLAFGVWTRTAAALAFLMVLNFHFASAAIFRYAFLTNGYGLPVLGSLLGVAVGGRSLPMSLRRS